MDGLKKVKLVIAAAAIVAALPVVGLAQQTTWTSSKIEKYNGYDYELWNQENKGNVSMKLTGDDGTAANAVGGTFEATWSSTINVLFRSGRKFTNGNTSGTTGQTHKQIGNMSVNFAATWSSGDNVKMLGIYGWAFYASGSVPTKQENGTSSSFSNQIEYYIIQDRGSYNAATGGTNSKKYGSANIDGIAYDFYVCDRIGQAMLTGSGNFKQYFSVPQNTSSHRQSGTVSVSKHFEEWEKVGMKMDGPLYEVAMKVESYTGNAQNSNGQAKVTKNILTIGSSSGGGDTPTPPANNNFTLTTSVSPSGSGTITQSPTGSSFAKDTKVTLTPVAKTGYKFDGWSGDASGTTNPLSVTMSTNKTITAKFVPIPDATTNLVKNGTFTDTSKWTLNTWQKSNGTFTVSGGNANITGISLPTDTGASITSLQLVQSGILLVQGVKYRVSFEASAASERIISLMVQMADNPWTVYFVKDTINLTTTKQTFTYDFEMTEPTDENARIGFNFGNAIPNVTISNVKLGYAVGDSPTGIAADRRVTSAASVKPTLRAAQSSSGVKVSFKASESGAATLRLYSLKGDVLSTAGLQTVSGVSYTHVLRPVSGKLPGGFYMVGLQRRSGATERASVMVR